MRSKIRITILLIVAVSFPLATRAQNSPYPVFASGLLSPAKVIFLTNNLVMVGESGTGTNDGRLSLLNTAGERHTLIEGLPSGIEPEPAAAISGPNSIAVRDRATYVSIGIGNTLAGSSMQPGTGTRLNPAPSSPIFSSLLEIVTDSDITFESGPFTLTRPQHDQLAGGSTIRLTNEAGERASIRVVVNFMPDAIEDRSLPGFRGPNPLDLVLDTARPHTLYITDGGLNRVVKVDTETGQSSNLASFDKIRKPPGVLLGGPFIDPVPVGMRQRGDSLFVVFLTGFPFASGVSQVHRINVATGADEVFIRDLTSCLDLEPVNDQTLLILQLSTNLFALPPRLPAPGRLLRVTPGMSSNTTVVADGLSLPNCIVRHPLTGEIFIAEIRAGRILRLMVP